LTYVTLERRLREANDTKATYPVFLWFVIPQKDKAPDTVVTGLLVAVIDVRGEGKCMACQICWCRYLFDVQLLAHFYGVQAPNG
jgi:hypothetical protein